jgi:hypothetical protein
MDSLSLLSITLIYNISDMPRIKPVTVFTLRTKPTTEYTKPREESPVSFDSVQITFDSDVYTWDATIEIL